MSTRSISSCWRIISVLVALVLTLPCAAQQIIGAGQGGQGWIVLRASIGRQPSWTLYHLPSTADPATIARVRTLASLPSHMAAANNRLLMVYEESAPDAESTRSVRQIRVREDSAQSRPRYEPPARAQVLPSLPGWGTLQGFVALPQSAVALLADPENDRLELLGLNATSWDTIALPDDISTQSVWGLAPVGESFGIIGLDKNTSLQRLWLHHEEGASSSAQWQESVPIQLAPTDKVVTGAGNSIVILQRQTDDTIAAWLHRVDNQVRLASLNGVGSEYVAMNVANVLILIWQEEDPLGSGSTKDLVQIRLRAIAMSPISGEILLDDYAKPQPLLTNNDMQKLTLLFGAVLVMILLFVLRPDPVALGALHVPEGYAVAPPGRRLLAAAIDLLPVVAISAGIFNVSALSALGIDVNSAQFGLWPVLATAAMACGLQTSTEWFFGFTPGKYITGCRTRHAEGGRASARQCLVRNLVKYACPPLAALMLLDPTRRHPGDYLAGTVVVMEKPTSPDSPTKPDSANQASDDATEEPGDSSA